MEVDGGLVSSLKIHLWPSRIHDGMHPLHALCRAVRLGLVVGGARRWSMVQVAW